MGRVIVGFIKHQARLDIIIYSYFLNPAYIQKVRVYNDKLLWTGYHDGKIYVADTDGANRITIADDADRWFLDVDNQGYVIMFYVRSLYYIIIFHFVSLMT